MNYQIETEYSTIRRTNINKRMQQILFLIIVILLTLSSVIMYSRLNGNVFPVTKLFYIFLLFCLATTLIWSKSFLQRSLTLSFILCIYLSLHIILSDTSAITYSIDIIIPYFCCLFFSSEIIAHKKTQFLFLAFSNFVCFFAAISLFCWLFGSILGILPGRQAGTYYWAGYNYPTYHYFYLYFENPVQATSLGRYSIPRNTGIYMEAPGYSSVLSTALIIELLVRKGGKKHTIALLVITLVSTLSTKGFLILLELAVLLSYFKLLRKGNRQIKILFFFIFIGIVLGVTAIAAILMIQKSSTGSFSIRMDDVQATLKTFIAHPFFGVGYDNTTPIVANMKYLNRRSFGLSMGLFVLLAEGGIYLFLFYLMAYILFYRKMEKIGKKKEAVIIGTVLFTDLLISNHQFSARYILIVSLGYAYGAQKK